MGAVTAGMCAGGIAAVAGGSMAVAAENRERAKYEGHQPKKGGGIPGYKKKRHKDHDKWCHSFEGEPSGPGSNLPDFVDYSKVKSKSPREDEELDYGKSLPGGASDYLPSGDVDYGMELGGGGGGGYYDANSDDSTEEKKKKSKTPFLDQAASSSKKKKHKKKGSEEEEQMLGKKDLRGHSSSDEDEDARRPNRGAPRRMLNMMDKKEGIFAQQKGNRIR